MVIPDVNVLIYAFRKDMPSHGDAHSWLTTCLGDPAEEVLVPDLVWVGFLRICTNPRIFNEPSSTEEATDFVKSVLAQPSYRTMPVLGIEPLMNLLNESQSRGDLVTDAYIACVARQLGATVATYDRDFRRFDDVRLITP